MSRVLVALNTLRVWEDDWGCRVIPAHLSFVGRKDGQPDMRFRRQNAAFMAWARARFV